MYKPMSVYDEQRFSYIPEEIQDAFNSIHYTKDYQYLYKRQDQYFLLQLIKVHPEQPKLHLTLYQDMETFLRNKVSYNNQSKNVGVKKICDLKYHKQTQFYIKIPLTKNDIEIEVIYERGEHLFGTLQMNHQQQTIVLYDKKGNKKGYLICHLQQITSQIKQHLSPDHQDTSQIYKRFDTDSQQNSILLKRYGNRIKDNQFKTIQEQEYSQQQRTKTVTDNMNEQTQNQNNQKNQLFKQNKRQQKSYSRIQAKNLMNDSLVKLQKMDSIKALLAANSNKYTNHYNRCQQPIRKSGYIKTFKKQKNINPSSIVLQQMKIEKLSQKIQKKESAQPRIKDRFNLISKNFQMKILNTPERPKIIDLYNSYQNILGKSQQQQSKQADQIFMNLDMVFTNISVTLYQSTYGKKHLLLILQPFSYTTQSLYGNHLLWLSKGYNFRNILSFNQLTVILKITTDYGQQQTIVKKNIAISEILQDQNKSFHQSYLFNAKKQKIGVIILGFQINKKDKIQDKFQDKNKFNLNRSIQNKSSHSKKSRKDTFFQNSIVYQYMPKSNKAISLRSLTSQSRKKYDGGRNIKLSKANRFPESKQKSPGPGQYKVDSIFKRYK